MSFEQLARRPLDGRSPAGPALGRLDWMDPVKALALLAIMLVHLTEEFGGRNWYTNPGDDYPAWPQRLHAFFPALHASWSAWLRFVGSLGAYPAQPVYFPESWHWNANGHRAVAEALLQTLSARGLIPPQCAPAPPQPAGRVAAPVARGHQ
jgi:hypothetical protein